jgi:hypothetical protein
MAPLVDQRRNLNDCSAEGCTAQSTARGMCITHYNATLRNSRKIPCPSCNGMMSPNSAKCRKCRNTHPEKLDCKQCGAVIPASEFRRTGCGGTARSGWSANCNKCVALNSIIREKIITSGAGNVLVQLTNLRVRAKMLSIPWEDVVNEYPEDGRCQSCGRTQIEAAPGNRAKNLCLDHCHDSNRMRGFLCSPCNVGIGALGDTAERVAQALAYLTKKGTER